MARGAPDYAASRIPARAKLGYDEPVEIIVTTVAAIPIENLDSPPVPNGKVWHITNAILLNATSIQPGLIGATATAAGQIPVMGGENIPAMEPLMLLGEFWLEATDFFRGTFLNANVGDNLSVSLHGTQIDTEL